MNRRAFALGIVSCLTAGLGAQQQEPVNSGTVIRSETRLVLVDAVVTDKKGAYVRDLSKKDFKVFEDNKEQQVKSFSFEADPNSPTASQPRYLVLFFDNSTMSPQAGSGMGVGFQMQARQAAMKFIDSNAAPNHLMAVVNYGGALDITQNFTNDVDRLKAAVQGIKVASVSPNATGGAGGAQIGSLGRQAASFARLDMILALREMAKNLATVPGRKSLILLTAGFPVPPDLLQEVTATIDVCNKANVAIYPIDVRGLVAAGGQDDEDFAMARPAPVFFRTVAYAAPFQTKGGTGGGGTGGSPAPVSGGGRTSGGGSAGNPGSGRPGSGTGTGGTGTGSGHVGSTAGGGGGATVPGTPIPSNINARNFLLPKFPESATTNQQLMYMLADGTGGFVILNTNDLLGGLEKIGKEQDEHYLLGYTPPDTEEGTCHALKVKVERGGTSVRARTGYCNAKLKDILKQTPVETTLESRVSSSAPGTFKAEMQTAFFYTAPNVARVQVTMDLPADALKFTKDKGKEHGIVNVLGIAYKNDGSVAARFSDAVKLDFEDKKDVELFKQHPYHYENQFDIASGSYDLKVAFTSGGEGFGKLEVPLNVDPYDGATFAMSGLALSDKFVKTTDPHSGVEAALLEDRTPLVVSGIEVVPSAETRFKNSERVGLYVEIYEPRLVTMDPEKPPMVALQMRVLDPKSNEVKADTGMFKLKIPDKAGNPAIPFGGVVPVNGLAPGTYRLEVTAMNDANKVSKRLMDFNIVE